MAELHTLPDRTVELTVDDIDWIREKLTVMDMRSTEVHSQIFARLQQLEVDTAINKVKIGMWGGFSGGSAALGFEVLMRLFGA